MQKPRRHERLFLLADVAVQPNGKRPQRWPARTFNLSKSGAAVFSKRLFNAGEIVGVEIRLPVAGRSPRTFMLYATVRHAKIEPAGNLLGLEFVVGPDAGDYGAFERYMEERTARMDTVGRSGFTLVEVCVVMSVLCLLVTMSMPLYTRAVEQCRVDVASAKLRTLWSAQRVYWLEQRAFADSLAGLEALDLLDSSLFASQSNPDAVFVYQVVTADEESFLAKAMRNGSVSWIGQIQIDEQGAVTGQIGGPDGQTVLPTP